MKRFDGIDDFEATIRIMREDEGGRRPPVFNGVRWDFCYAEDDSGAGIWIYPDFHDAAGESFPEAQPLPVDAQIAARMFVLSDQMRDEVHRKKVRVGGRFYCHEGARRVAEGTITRITGLFRDRKKTGQQGARANAGICHAACYRRNVEMKLQKVNRKLARSAPAPVVAHL